jgi:ribosomal protein S18 acetylase RimI-like enzyme
MSTVDIRQAKTEEEIAIAREIFREYEAWLGLDLCFQGFEDELKNLPGKYAPPAGRLYLAWVDRSVAGCIALRPLGPKTCEMKRLFVRENFRGMQIGRLLIERVITDAIDIGYDAMRLDTFPPKMGKAVRLYESYGFREIAPYYENPNDGVLFMELSILGGD